MNAATSVSVKKITFINHGGHNIRETTSTSFSVAQQSAESETDAGNFSVSYVSAFSVARQSGKSETDSLEDLLAVIAVENQVMQRMLSERRAALGLPVRDPQESDPTRQQPSNPTNYFDDM
ncbi:hypothetical protein YC2023_050279 [Brassica napus]